MTRSWQNSPTYRSGRNPRNPPNQDPSLASAKPSAAEQVYLMRRPMLPTRQSPVNGVLGKGWLPSEELTEIEARGRTRRRAGQTPLAYAGRRWYSLAIGWASSVWPDRDVVRRRGPGVQGSAGSHGYRHCRGTAVAGPPTLVRGRPPGPLRARQRAVQRQGRRRPALRHLALAAPGLAAGRREHLRALRLPQPAHHGAVAAAAPGAAAAGRLPAVVLPQGGHDPAGHRLGLPPGRGAGPALPRVGESRGRPPEPTAHPGRPDARQRQPVHPVSGDRRPVRLPTRLRPGRRRGARPGDRLQGDAGPVRPL